MNGPLRVKTSLYFIRQLLQRVHTDLATYVSHAPILVGSWAYLERAFRVEAPDDSANVEID